MDINTRGRILSWTKRRSVVDVPLGLTLDRATHKSLRYPYFLL